MQLKLNDKDFELLYEKALYLPQQKLLIIADVHLGKVAHFRKEGIALSASAQRKDYLDLQNIFQKIEPQKVYFLGDLFHSAFNNDWISFCELINSFKNIEFILIKGNHDLIDPNLFLKIGILVVDQIDDESIIYSHEPLKKIPKDKINICGHIHPGIVLNGTGKQSIKLPCFYLSENLFILPAFGVLTGLFPMKKIKNIQAYGILSSSVIRVL